MTKKQKHPLDGARNAAMEIISKIADRAVILYAMHEVRAERMTIMMDIMACHFDGQKLRLEDLLAADDMNFLHDIGGINRHLNRVNYELSDGFRPRFSKKAA
jgi:hypothetical protein